MTPAKVFQVVISHQQARGVLQVTTRGPIDHTAMRTLLHASADAAAEYNCHRFFLDHRSSPLQLSPAEMLNVPDEVRARKIENHKAALLFTHIGKTELLLEHSCHHGGLDAKVFTDPVEALLWLTVGAQQRP